MYYTVQQLATLAGVTGRTLRYYDSIHLLKPAETTEAGYRLYGVDEVDRLQQILFLRELELPLDTIKGILDSPHFDEMAALRQHRSHLAEQKRRIERLLATVDQTLRVKEGGKAMLDKEKFAGFKKKLVDDNEREYGDEVREKYGNEAADRSNKAFLNMSESQYAEFEKLGTDIISALETAMKSGDPTGPAAQRAVRLHHRWLEHAWGHYDKNAHAGLAQMYVDDERFRRHYDQHGEGMAVFLRDAVHSYTKR